MYDSAATGNIVKTVRNYVSGGPSDSQTNVATTAYDAAGNATLVTQPNGDMSTTTFDGDNRATEAAAKSSSGTVVSDTKTSYDAAGRTLSTQAVDGASNPTTNYTYDAAGRTATQTAPPANPSASDQSGQSNVTAYAYSATGQVTDTKVTNAAVSGTVSNTTAAYSPLGQTTSKTAQAGTSEAQTTSYTYDKDGQAASQTDASGTSHVDRDALGRVVTAWHPDGSQDSATYDKAGHTLSSSYGTTTTTTTYDPLWRASSEQVTDTSTGKVEQTASYTYDANHNRTSLTTSAGTTTYAYDSASDTELTNTTDPTGKVTPYSYDSSGNLQTATYDPTGAKQQTSYKYDTTGRLNEVDKPDGSKVTYTYDADGNRLTTTVVSGGPVPTQTQVKDVYQAGRIAYETDGAGTTLAIFSYDANGTPTSVVIGSDPVNGPRYYYVYNPHGDVVALTDMTGTVVASYSYDTFGVLTSSSETFPNNTAGWTNPYRYDGRDGVRYDSATRLGYSSTGRPTISMSLSALVEVAMPARRR